MYDWLKSFRSNPRKARAIADLFPGTERREVKRITELLLKMRFSRAELEAERTLRLARLVEEHRDKPSGKAMRADDPTIMLQMGTSAIGGDDVDLGPYMACYLGAALTLPELVVLAPATKSRDGGGVIFTFGWPPTDSQRFPKGTYCFWVDLHPASEQKKPKIACFGACTSELIPGGRVEKEIVPSAEYPYHWLSGMDMTWEVTADCDRAVFLIRNCSYDYLACLGVSMIAFV